QLGGLAVFRGSGSHRPGHSAARFQCDRHRGQLFLAQPGHVPFQKDRNMTASEFNHRNCPLCGSGVAQGEVHSARPAQTLTLDALQPFWSGLFKEKLFFSYHRCDHCGLLYNPVYFDDRQLSELYANMAPNMELVANDAIVATQRGYFERAARTARLDGGYLEIGPDVGYIVADAARTGNFEHF